MKRILIVAVGTIFAFSVNAQTTIGLKGGANLANWTVKEDGQKDDEYKSRGGFHFGVVIDQAISENFSIQPHVLFVNKGAAIDHGDHKDNAIINAIDIPVNFLYKAPAGAGKFFIGGGPNLGFNLSGTVKSDEHEDEKIEIGGEIGELKRFDFGLNLLAGYELSNGLFFSANYTPGFTNLQNVPSSVDFTRRSTYLGISVGYFFGKNASAKR